MFRKFCKVAFHATMIAWGVNCLAANTVDVNVTARVTPGACNLTLSNGGLIDFGNIVRGQLLDNRVTSLPEEKSINFNITCDAPTKIAFNLQDMRASSMYDTQFRAASFGLGFHGQNRKIGAVTYNLSRSRVDGMHGGQIAELSSIDNGATWSFTNWLGSSNTGFMPGQKRAYGAMPAKIPSPYTTYEGRIVARVHIAPAKDLDIAAGFNMDGLTIFEIFYL